MTKMLENTVLTQANQTFGNSQLESTNQDKKFKSKRQTINTTNEDLLESGTDECSLSDDNSSSDKSPTKLMLKHK
jgi:hypothetical protein